MRLGKDLIDKSVVSITDGRIIGTVRDIYLTPDLNDLAGIYLGSEGLLRRKALLIPASAVSVFGIDAILVQHADVVTNNKELAESADWVRLSTLQGREVDTPGGTRVAVLGDIVLDEQGHISGFALSRVYVSGPIAEQRVIQRSAVLDSGHQDGVMTIDLALAERPDQMIADQSADSPIKTMPPLPSFPPVSTPAEETPDQPDETS
jgi:uncharacterized protein YrrD